MEPVLRSTQLVREEFEAVAWSQHGLFDEQPGKRVLSVYPDLGKPTLAKLFILHLEYLAFLMLHDTDDRKITMRDAKTFYNSLMKNMPATADDQDVIVQESLPHDTQDRAIFLNINEKPEESEPWTWRKATEPVYNAPDEAGLFSVRSFLKEFQTLLMQVGATSVHRPSVPLSPIIMPSEKEFYHPRVGHILDYIYSSSPLLPPNLSLNTFLEMLSLAGQWYLDELVNLTQEEIINEDIIIPQNIAGVSFPASSKSSIPVLILCFFPLLSRLGGNCFQAQSDAFDHGFSIPFEYTAFVFEDADKSFDLVFTTLKAGRSLAALYAL
ncbi:hypothetical protein BJ165DRAFT_1531437 [Panaeolus papilionaceus]|nr:hypothetical protein BJ165DRAFT_1531437 [Panaeolus papilionaceus]